MLKIINNLSPFFEDCYRRVNVREYAKIIRVSPPTASKMLDSHHTEGLLARTFYKNYILFYANKDDKVFIDLSRIYWRYKLEGVIEAIEKSLTAPTVILFGSLSKAENKEGSDVDLCVFGDNKKIDLSKFEKKLKRKVQTYLFNSLKDIKNRELATNIINGYLLKGKLSL